MSQYKYAEIGDTVYFWFAANTTAGAAGDGASPLYDVRLAGAASNAAPTASGTPTLLSHADYTDGLHEIAIDTTGQAAGEYAVFCTLTISTVNPAGFCGSYKLRTAGTGALVADLTATIKGATFDGATDSLEAIRNKLPTNLEDLNITDTTGLVRPDMANASGNYGGTVATVTTLTNHPATVTVGTNNDKTGYALSSTGADLILKSSTFVQAIVAAVNELATYGLTALNTLLVTTGIKASTIPAVTGATLHSDYDAAKTAATATNLATVDTVVDAIKVQTDKFVFTVANQVDANIQSINDVTITGDGSTGTEFGV